MEYEQILVDLNNEFNRQQELLKYLNFLKTTFPFLQTNPRVANSLDELIASLEAHIQALQQFILRMEELIFDLPFVELPYYIVRPGDTLFRIARRFNTTVDALVAANRITNPNRLSIGQRLIIPAE